LSKLFCPNSRTVWPGRWTHTVLEEPTLSLVIMSLSHSFNTSAPSHLPPCMQLTVILAATWNCCSRQSSTLCTILISDIDAGFRSDTAREVPSRFITAIASDTYTASASSPNYSRRYGQSDDSQCVLLVTLSGVTDVVLGCVQLALQYV
jgi:hypothetical protein